MYVAKRLKSKLHAIELMYYFFLGTFMHACTTEDATIPGYDSESSLKHVHCPRCGKIIAKPKELCMHADPVLLPR